MWFSLLKLNKCDLLVIHWIHARSANAASKVPAGVHSNRGNNLHVFTGATVCWLANALLELFSDVCLSAEEMLHFCCCVIKRDATVFVEVHCRRKCEIPRSSDCHILSLSCQGVQTQCDGTFLFWIFNSGYIPHGPYFLVFVFLQRMIDCIQ